MHKLLIKKNTNHRKNSALSLRRIIYGMEYTELRPVKEKIDHRTTQRKRDGTMTKDLQETIKYTLEKINTRR
jgi:hypothetical protein